MNQIILNNTGRAAYKILADAGYHGLSFAKMSALSGVARPTLKLRWHTREDMYIATVKYTLEARDCAAAPCPGQHR